MAKSKIGKWGETINVEAEINKMDHKRIMQRINESELVL
jgi:hypothetical protein